MTLVASRSAFAVTGRQQIIVNFSAPPSADDLAVIARCAVETLPDELVECSRDLQLRIEEFPDTATEQELGLEDPYDLLALFHAGGEIAPGVQRKICNDDDVLVLYRRPILDMWCEGGEDLALMVRQIVIGELGEQFDFTEDEIEEMASRHFQGLL